MKKAKHLAEEYGEKAVNKVKSVRDEGKKKKKRQKWKDAVQRQLYLFIYFKPYSLYSCSCC